MAIQGTLQAEQASPNRRSAARRKLHLEVTGETVAATGNVTLLNLSTTGVLLRTQVSMHTGERIRLAFVGDEVVSAKVVWVSDDLFGCRFEKPISQAAASAASLRSSFTDAGAPASPQDHLADTFGGRVQRLRRQRGMSLQALAGRVGVSKPALWKWERGDVRPRPAALTRLAQALGVSAADLMFGGEVARSGDAGQPGSLHTILDSTKSQVAALLGVDAGAVEVTVSIRD